MDEKRKWYGLTEDEWIALVVVLLAGLLLSGFFMRGCRSAETLTDASATPIAIITGSNDETTIVLDNAVQEVGEVTFSGAASPNAAVEVFLDGNSIGTANADARGAWTLSHTMSEMGRYAAYARAEDTDGRTDESGVLNFRVDEAGMSGQTAESNDDDGEAESASDRALDAETETAMDAQADDGQSAGGAAGLAGNVSGATEADGAPSSVAPTIAMPGSVLEFGAVYMNGTADPNSGINLLVDGQLIGSTNADGAGMWEYTAPIGDINYGEYEMQAASGELASEPLPFVMRPPAKPTFDNNLDGVVGTPGQYRVSGKGTPNWKVQYSVNNVPFERPTDENGAWEDTEVRLEKAGCYQFRLAALDANGIVIPETQSGPDNVIITEDGGPADGVCPTSEGGAGGSAADEEQAASNSAESESAAQADTAAADAESEAAPAEGSTEGDNAATNDGSAADAGTATEGVAEDGSTLGAALAADGNYTVLLAAMDAAGLGDVLAGSDAPVTLFAPNDAAFAALPDGAIDVYLDNPDLLGELLSNHVVAGALNSEDVRAFSSAEPPTLENVAGNLLEISADERGLAINGTTIAQPDMTTTNGVIHGLDGILLPPFNPPPVIDVQGVPTFEGTVLTVVGSAAPDTVLLLEINGENFGTTVVGGDGNWIVSGDVSDGQYEIIAYTYDTEGLLLAISNIVELIVLNE